MPSTPQNSGLQLPKDRRPYPQLNAFRPFVMNELSRRAFSYPNPFNSPFVRMTSCKIDRERKHIFFTLGLHGYTDDNLNIFNPTYGGGLDIVGYSYDYNTKSGNDRTVKTLVHTNELTRGTLSPALVARAQASGSQQLNAIAQSQQAIINQQNTAFAKGAHPIPGITNISVTRRGVGLPLTAEVQYKCYNRAQLEFIRNHFMVAGGGVVIEWGSQYSDYKPTKILDFSKELDVRQTLSNSVLLGRSYIIENWVEPNNGNYDFMVGKVSNFNVTLDGKTGIYDCTTSIVSVGEQMWGLDNNLTFVYKTPTPDSNDIQQPTTFHDYYLLGGKFDIFVEANAGNTANVLDKVANAAKLPGVANKLISDVSKRFDGYSTNPEDYRFISWNFFIKNVIPDMLNLIKDDTIRDELSKYIKFYVDKIDISMDQDDWVGNNKYLRSTDPDTMILVRQDMIQIEPAFTQGGIFDNPQAGEERGQLTSGVWITTHAIRECFSTTGNFQSAISSLLNRMSAATVGYWNLRMVWDENQARYRIIDENYINKTGVVFPMYKFNVGSNGELLNVNLDSAFPPELITQMMFVGKFQTESQPTQEDLLNHYPSLGTTATSMFSLNWTNLQDILDQDITQTRSGSVLVPVFPDTANIFSPTVGTSIGSVDNQRSIAQVAGGGVGNVGPTSVAGISPQLQGKKLGQRAYSLSDPETFPTTTVRNSVNPIFAPVVSVLATNLSRYDSQITAASNKYGVDPDLIRAIIVNESGTGHGDVNPNAYRQETGDASVGLMQVLYKAHGFSNPYELEDPATNIDAGTQILAQNLADRSGDMEAAISMYNGGRGIRATTSGSFFTLDHVKGIRQEVPIGQFGNYQYVNRVMGSYNLFRQYSNKPTATDSVTGNIPIASVPTKTLTQQLGLPEPGPTKPLNAEDQALSDWKDNLSSRFGAWAISMIELQPSAMINKITRDGFDGYGQNIANAFVAPYPLTTTVDLDLQGIAGMSITDGFFVDKLPFVFERHGLFQIVETVENITEQGWITKLHGRFKLMWMHGEGPTLPMITAYTGPTL